MSRKHIDHSDILRFAQDKVNLPKDKADEYRVQAGRLRDRLESYLEEHKEFSLKKMLLSGSLAKGTSLRSISDIDLACYISGADAPKDAVKLLEYLAERLLNAFPNFKKDQINPQTYSVTVSFKGTGLDVDVVPILFDGDPDWYGNLISQDDGSFLRTNIPLHLEFVRKRKHAQELHFAQVVRLIKFWAAKTKKEKEGFRFKSFMVELILGHIADTGTNLSDYPEALQSFFTYIARGGLREQIAFDDYYKLTEIEKFTDRIKIIDPVNSKNNVSRLYTNTQTDMIVEAAIDAGEAIDSALMAPTKQETVRYWQKVFGNAFQG